MLGQLLRSAVRSAVRLMTSLKIKIKITSGDGPLRAGSKSFVRRSPSRNTGPRDPLYLLCWTWGGGHRSWGPQAHYH